MTTATLPSAAYDFEAPLGEELKPEDFANIAQQIIAEGRNAGATQKRNELWKSQEMMYWRVRPNPRHEGWKARANWIIPGPGSGTVDAASEMARFQQLKECDPLYEYGSYEGGGGTNNRNPLLVDRVDVKNPYGCWTELFQKPGGLAAMPKSQLVSLGFHRIPEIRKARTDLHDVIDYVCELCPPGTSVFTRSQDRGQHMSIIHKNERQSELAARINADAIERIRDVVAPGIDPNLIASIVAATVAAMNGNAPAPAPVAAPVVDPDSRPQLLKYIAEHKLSLPEGRSVMSLTKDEALAIVNAHRTAASAE